jgi:hypothetical protein
LSRSATESNISSQIKETIDNGGMVRKIERLHNVKELVTKQKESDTTDITIGIV